MLVSFHIRIRNVQPFRHHSTPPPPFHTVREFVVSSKKKVAIFNYVSIISNSYKILVKKQISKLLITFFMFFFNSKWLIFRKNKKYVFSLLSPSFVFFYLSNLIIWKNLGYSTLSAKTLSLFILWITYFKMVWDKIISTLYIICYDFNNPACSPFQYIINHFSY